MPQHTERPIWLGALVAPSIAPLLYYVGVLVLTSPPVSGLPDVLVGLYVVGLFGLPVAYVSAILLGIPGVLLLRAIGALCVEWTMLLSAVSGAAALLAFYAVLWGGDFIVTGTATKTAQYAVAGAVLGLSVGAVFCKVCGITRRSSRRSQARAA